MVYFVSVSSVCTLFFIYLSIFLSLSFSLFAKLYVDASEGDADALAAETVYAFAAIVSATWACSYSLFFTHIKKGYKGTFIDTTNAVQYNVDIFNDPKASDYQKAAVMAKTRR